MTDVSFGASAPGLRRQPGDRAEYRLYFALIFLATLPVACLLWPLSALGVVGRRDRGPVGTAWRQACTITPIIFWG